MLQNIVFRFLVELKNEREVKLMKENNRTNRDEFVRESFVFQHL